MFAIENSFKKFLIFGTQATIYLFENAQIHKFIPKNQVQNLWKQRQNDSVSRWYKIIQWIFYNLLLLNKYNVLLLKFNATGFL